VVFSPNSLTVPESDFNKGAATKRWILKGIHTWTRNISFWLLSVYWCTRFRIHCYVAAPSSCGDEQMYSRVCDHPNYIAKQGHFSILCLFFEAIQCTVPGTKFHRANFSIAALTVQINHLKGQQPETVFWLNEYFFRRLVFSIVHISESTPMFSKYCPFIDRHIRHCWKCECVSACS
jgi:hypothetical protein